MAVRDLAWLLLPLTSTACCVFAPCCPLRNGVETRTTLSTYGPGSVVAIVFVNGRDHQVKDIQLPSTIKLERHEVGGWRFVDTWWRHVGEEDVLLYVEPCTSVRREIRLPDRLSPGRYRFVFHNYWVTNAFVVSDD